jgi:hypothetical protein
MLAIGGRRTGMNRATPRLRDVAKRLILAEAARTKSPAKDVTDAFPVTDKLRPQLASLMGEGGTRALIARALALAIEEVSWLRSLHVNANGGLEGLQAQGAQLDPADYLEGRVVLLAQLLGLLVAFIGSGLTLRLVSEVWPRIPLKGIDFGTEQ